MLDYSNGVHCSECYGRIHENPADAGPYGDRGDLPDIDRDDDGVAGSHQGPCVNRWPCAHGRWCLHGRLKARCGLRPAPYCFVLFVNSATRIVTSCLDCLSNSISDSVSARGVEQITCFRLCKAVEAEAESLTPPVFKFFSMFVPQCFKRGFGQCQDCRMRLACCNACARYNTTTTDDMRFPRPAWALVVVERTLGNEENSRFHAIYQAGSCVIRLGQYPDHS